VLVLPFVLRSVYVSLRNLDQRLELAAASLGASPARVLGTITLLLIPVQILLIGFSMRGFQQAWNVEVERTRDDRDDYDRGGGQPAPAAA